MQCALCPNQVDPKDLDVLQEKLSWVGDVAGHSEYTGRVAHRDCVRQLSEPQQVDGQEPLFNV